APRRQHAPCWSTSDIEIFPSICAGITISDVMRARKWLALLFGLACVVSCLFMAIPERVFRHAELNAEMQEVRVESNKVRTGMTINEVLPLVHGMDILASADGVWLSVLPDNRRFYYSPDPIEVWRHDDGTFSFSCHCGSEQVSPNSPVTETQAAAL